MKTLLVAALMSLAAPAFGQDAIDLSRASLNGGADVRAWPVTTTITGLSTSPQGMEATFSKRQGFDWPDVIPTGWQGPVYYTVWLGTRLQDGVHLAASLNVYRGQIGSGSGDVTNIGQYSLNLWYLDEALKAHVVTEGETLYLMVTAGGLRGANAVSVAERSNVVAFQASSVPRAFSYAAPPPVVIPPPVVTPPPVVAPPPLPSADLSAIIQQASINQAALMAELAALRSQIEVIKRDADEFHNQVRSKYVAFMDSPIVRYGIAVIGGWLVTKAANK